MEPGFARAEGQARSLAKEPLRLYFLLNFDAG